MRKSPKFIAEQQFAATQKENKRVGKEKDKARQEQSEKMARLRKLRLDQEAADRETGEAADPAKPPKSESPEKVGKGVGRGTS